MSYRTLLTHVVADKACQSRLRMTASVARALNAEVIGLGVQAPWPYDTARGRGAYYQQVAEVSRTSIASASALFREAFTDPSVRASWRENLGYPNRLMAEQARVADLVVAYPTAEDPDTSTYATADGLVMTSGLPVLLLPRKETAFRGARVLFAWKNTREARHALGAALPLLRRAERVLVAAVCKARELEAVEAQLADVAQRLGRHGVNAATLAEVASPGAAGRKLIRIAGADRSDLIVAGAYGHSRLREWVLGGVTRDLIADGGRYVLLAH